LRDVLGDLCCDGGKVEDLTFLRADDRSRRKVAAAPRAHGGSVDDPVVWLFHLREMMSFCARLFALASFGLATLRPIQFRLFAGLVAVARWRSRGVLRGPPELGFQICDPALQLSYRSDQLGDLGT
jgi:hypothetical protein